MERSKKLILIVVGFAALLIIWQVGFNPSSEPAPKSEENENDSDIQIESRQPDAELADRIPTSREMMQPDNTQEQNPENPERRQRYENTNNDRRNMVTNADNTNFKIAIPENIETAQLRVLYDEYLQISSSIGGRTGRSSRRGGFGDFGGRSMGGFGGMDMSGFMERRGGFGDNGGQMNGSGDENNQ
jgi:hypothetical protein